MTRYDEDDDEDGDEGKGKRGRWGGRARSRGDESSSRGAWAWGKGKGRGLVVGEGREERGEKRKRKRKRKRKSKRPKSEGTRRCGDSVPPRDGPGAPSRDTEEQTRTLISQNKGLGEFMTRKRTTPTPRRAPRRTKKEERYDSIAGRPGVGENPRGGDGEGRTLRPRANMCGHGCLVGHV